MSRRLHFAGAMVVLVTGCGGGSGNTPGHDPADSAPGDASASGSCQDRASSGSVTVVDLRVSSPLPSAFTVNCPHGAVSTLEAYLLDAVPSGACQLVVSSSAVAGCCEGVPANQNPWLTLAYRETGLKLWLADQGKMVLLPSTGPPVVDVSFAGVAVETPYDTDQDDHDNLAEWCTGTLSL